MDLTIEKVEVTFLQRRTKTKRSNWNNFDSIFTSKKCKYAIENFRVEQKQIMKN
jgi:hypothetical protein